MSQLGQELKFSEQQGMNTEGVSWNSSGLLAQGPGFLMSVCAQLSCDPVDCSPPGSSVHGIFQARILEWVAISFSRGSSKTRVPRGPATSTGSLASQRNPGKFPKVPGRRRGHDQADDRL